MLQTVFDATMAAIMFQAGNPGLAVVGLSGGCDSAALLSLAKRWADSLEGRVRLVACHLNHRLRGDAADGDADFCRARAADLAIDYRERAVDVNELAREMRMGLEEAGRFARLRFFRDVIGDVPGIALTAHHADDQAETILLHLRRGAHRRGLGGMKRLAVLPVPPDRTIAVARPLLEIPKDRIVEFAKSRGLTWREDATNQDETFARNRIRHSVIPSLEAILPGFRERLLDKAKKVAAEEEYLTVSGRKLVTDLSSRENGGLLFRLQPMALDHPETLLYAFRHILEEEMGDRLPYGAVLSRLSVLAESGRVGEGLSLPGGVQVRREQDGLFFFYPEKMTETAEAEVMLPDPPFEISVNNLVITAQWRPLTGMPPGDDMLDPEVEWMNPLAIRWPLTLRPPHPGERFRPLGAPGARKLQDVMVDLKLPRRKRGDARVLADHAGAIWLWPYRLAHRVRLPGSQLKALRMSIRAKDEEP